MALRRYILPLLIMTGLVLLQTGSTGVCAKPRPHISYADSIRIVEAYRLNHVLAGKVWPAWQATHSTFILVCNDYEFLIGASTPDKGFQRLSTDSLMGQPVFIRSRMFPKDTFATIFYIHSQPTVVAGQPGKTYTKNSTRWILAVNHELFHVYQFSRPEYDQALETMNLVSGAPTGSWMIRYTFPYDNTTLNTDFSNLATSLDKAIQTKQDKKIARHLLKQLDQARTSFVSKLTYDDKQYFDLQVWQEGIARYFEYSLSKEASKSYSPTYAFETLSDFIPFKKASTEISNNLYFVLPRMTLSGQHRLTFYYIGFAEGLLLDQTYPNWKQNYFNIAFNLGNLLFPVQSLANLK